jgi:hypothetical protein
VFDATGCDIALLTGSAEVVADRDGVGSAAATAMTQALSTNAHPLRRSTAILGVRISIPELGGAPTSAAKARSAREWLRDYFRRSG